MSNTTPSTPPDIFGVLADPTRRALLQALRDRLDSGESAVAVPDLVEATGATRQSVNRHLTILTDAALLTVADDGPHRTYTLNTTPLEAVEDWLAPFVGLAPQPGEAVAPEFSAWAGADAGETIGRTVAERAFQVRSAADTVKKRLGSAVRFR
jgi:ArsR family transcriptional regulator, arsenate/arsenite/antimonite-responsive transcriptional repressor